MREFRPYRLKVCVSAGAVHDRVECGPQRHGMSTGGNLKVGSIGCAIHNNSVKAAGILPGRRQNATYAVDRAQVCIVEGIASTHLSIAWAVCLPRSERSARRYIAYRLWIDQIGFKLKGLTWSNARHFQVIDVEF